MIIIACVTFQFHKGTIRTAKEKEEQDKLNNFNSIKVRLEHLFYSPIVFTILFQFHKGTIRTH